METIQIHVNSSTCFMPKFQWNIRLKRVTIRIYQLQEQESLRIKKKTEQNKLSADNLHIDFNPNKSGLFERVVLYFKKNLSNINIPLCNC